jgi:hypothetical protein
LARRGVRSAFPPSYRHGWIVVVVPQFVDCVDGYCGHVEK